MAKKVWDNPIDINTPWDGNETTDNLPVGGTRVEEFIKNTFRSKFGKLYYDVANNRYLVFSDQMALDAYLEDPTQTDLVLGTFDAPFNYTAEITLMSPTYKAVFLGSTGNYIDFTFDIKNKQGASTGENVNVTYTFIRNADKKVITETRRYGEAVHFNIDEYIKTGTNTIIVGVTGQTTLAATTVAMTYQVVDLTLEDELDISAVHNLTNGARVMEVFFTVGGYGTKTVEWFLDGEQLPFVKSEDEVVDVTSSRTKYITLANLSSGAHTLQFRAYTLINGEKFYTETLYREILIHNGDVDTNYLVVATSLPYSHGIVNESNPLVFYGAEQYLPYEIRFATRRSADVAISLDGNNLATVTTSAGRETEYSIVSNKAGTLSLKFAFSGVEREIPFAISATSLNIEEITTSLAFDFSARGRSNSAVDKDSWQYGGYEGTFEGFNWNASSGWVNNALLINSGASFAVNIAPLANDATITGKTLEFEFSTRNVENDDAVVCDLLGVNGAGLLITASEARLVSAAGEVVTTKFKAGETNRITFVINRKSGTTYKSLAFIYVNGILSGAINFGTADNYISGQTLLFSGSEDVQVELRSMRFYNMALSSENILNNYILYRDNLVDMMEVYYRNDIYEDGTVSFSPDKAQHRLPVMIVTGDIPTLEGATSTSTQITVDISYVNEQDPSKNFVMKEAAMRIQGTSSLAYPRKNFRIYTTKNESTIVYDANGAVIADKLYSFKNGAQPVDCWCLKADFAESSGTHNTGIARLWNDAMFNASIQHTNVLGQTVDGYALRTKAQVAALSAGYAYDVRTTIDGFPILLFYKKSASDTNLIFLGKYNFNNDKSTPSVFGFENIPNFDNSKVQCWETRDNGNPLGLFTDVSEFDENWSEAYESRYPDTKTPDTSYLKAFSVWVNEVPAENFATEKWEHLDVYKVAAYYVYLMRFGAVDQVVKNGFLTTEDGEHFFYINYDNDTVNGLINTGELRLDPEINRQTIGSDGEYVYAGHSSVLWNLLEADTEFMEIVKIVDNALYSAGLRYDNVITTFNEEQAAKWVERVYNQDAEYKYLLPFVNAGTNNLFMLQGSRSSHRSWWLSKRFSLYDSLFVSGNYRDRNISFKCLNDTQPGQQFTITAGTAMNYGYGVNNGTRDIGVELSKGENHTFVTTDTLNLGDVVKIFAASNLSALDLSALAARLAVLDCSASYDPSLGSKLKRLILGGAGQTNTELSAISGLGVLKSLQELNIENYKGITSLDLTSQIDFRKLYAIGSGLASVSFSKGAPVEHLELPASMLALELQQLPYLNTDNLVLESKENIRSITINKCPYLSSDFDFAYDWITTNMSSNSVFEMDEILWNDVVTSKLIEIGQIKSVNSNIKLLGQASVSSITLEQVDTLKELFGSNVFEDDADFQIKAPESTFLTGPTSIKEGESAQFSAVVFSDHKGTVKYSIVSGSRTGVSLDENTGLLTSIENGEADSTFVIRAKHTSSIGEVTFADLTLKVLRLTYPTSLSISGDSAIEDGEEYTLTVSPTSYTGNPTFVWELTGAAVDAGLIVIKEQNSSKCAIQLLSRADSAKTATLKCTAYKNDGVTVAATATKSLSVAAYVYPTAVTLSGPVSVKDGSVYTLSYTPESFDGPITSVVWGLSGDIATLATIDTKDNLQCTLKVTGTVTGAVVGSLSVIVTLKNGTELTSSMEVVLLDPTVLMTSVTNLEVMACMYSAGLAANESYMTYDEAAAVTDTDLQSGTSYSTSIFYKYGRNIVRFDEFEHFTGLTSIPTYCFSHCTSLVSLKLPPQITGFGSYAFGYSSGTCTKLTTLSIPENVTTIGSYALTMSKLTEIISYSKKISINSNALRYLQSSYSGVLKYRAGGDYSNWLTATYKLPSKWTMQEMYEPQEYTSLTIEADNTSGRAVATRCQWTLESNGLDTLMNEYVEGITHTGEDFTSEFEPNLGVNAVERVVYYSKGGLTASDIITLSAVQDFNMRVEYNITDISTPTCVLNTSTSFDLYSVVEMCVDGAPQSIPPVKNLQFNTVGTHYIDFLFKDNKIPTFCFYQNEIGSKSALVKALIHKNVVQLASSLGATNSGIFTNCKNLEAIEFEAEINITRIPGLFASSCESLKSIIIPEGVTHIGSSAFQSCEGLESVVLPSTIVTLGGYDNSGSSCFNNCKALRDIICLAEIAPNIDGNYSFSNAGANLDDTVEKVLWVPFGAIGYDTTNWTSSLLNPDKLNYVLKELLDIEGYRDLTISAPNVFAETVEVPINYSIIVYGTNLYTEQYEERILTGTETTAIEANNSTSDVEKTISFTYGGLTATTTVIQYGSTIVDGVYIQHIDGRLFTGDAWTANGFANDQANGVAVKAGNVGFVVAKNDLSSVVVWSNFSGVNVIGLPDVQQSSAAILDFNGVTNTSIIVSEYGDEYKCAALECTRYKFPNGSNGYLGACGELQIICNNRTALNSLLSLIGGSGLSDISIYWSSNENGNYYAWGVIPNSGSIKTYNKGTQNYVRPLTNL